MSKSNELEGEFIKAIFGSGSVTPTATLYIALHTASPGEGGNQTTNETTLGGYARQAVPVPGGWNTLADQADNAAEISFPEITSGSESITHFSIGTALSGAGSLFYLGELTAPIAGSTGITIKFAIGSIVVTEG